MNYDDYYELCKKAYNKTIDRSVLSDFYSNPVRLLPIESFGEEYMNLIDVLSSKVKDDFDANIDCDNDNIMMKHNNIWKFHEELLNISDIIVPYLEENRYGCHLYVDKIYIYRTLKLDNRVSSYSTKGGLTLR